MRLLFLSNTRGNTNPDTASTFEANSNSAEKIRQRIEERRKIV
jgi:hypothetical protein